MVHLWNSRQALPEQIGSIMTACDWHLPWPTAHYPVQWHHVTNLELRGKSRGVLASRRFFTDLTLPSELSWRYSSIFVTNWCLSPWVESPKLRSMACSSFTRSFWRYTCSCLSMWPSSRIRTQEGNNRIQTVYDT